MTDRIGQRLTKPRLEHRAKRVRKWDGFFDEVGLPAHPQWQDDFDDLIELIGKDATVPERYYRVSAGIDRLLENHGIMHLHLDHPGSDVIVYLVQYEDEVLLLGIGTHAQLAADVRKTWQAKRALYTSADRDASKRKAAAQKDLAAQGDVRKQNVAASIASLGVRRRRSIIIRPPEGDES